MHHQSNLKAPALTVPCELESLYRRYPEDVAAAAMDAARFVADLVDELAPEAEPWPPMTARSRR